MNKEEVLRNRKVWTDALRSGKYKQGTLKLCMKGLDDDFHHCCLGVAFEVAPEFGLKVERIEQDNGLVSFDGNLTGLNDEMKDALGLSHEGYGALIGMNDLGYSFEGIANYIDSLPLE